MVLMADVRWVKNEAVKQTAAAEPQSSNISHQDHRAKPAPGNLIEWQASTWAS
jgi:hypothetical protein